MAESLANNFLKHTFAAAAIGLAVENRIPGAEVQFAPDNGYYDLAPHNLAFRVRIGIVFTGAVVMILRRWLMRREHFQPVVVVMQQAVFSIVDLDAGCDVHGINQAEAFLHAAFVDQSLNLVCDMEIIPPVRRLKPKMFGQ